MRRYTAYMSGERFMADSRTKVVHNVENEKNKCNIDEIVRAGKELPFKTLAEANKQKYLDCNSCLEKSSKILKVFKPGNFHKMH